MSARFVFVKEQRLQTMNTLAVLLLAVCMILAGCGQQVVKSTRQTPLTIENAPRNEALLLDVGVLPFDAGLDEVDDDDETVLAEVRNAEAGYMATYLAGTIQRTAAWGAVRVLPGNDVVIDVTVTGKILYSDGERLELLITVRDVSGREWYSKEYEEIVGKYSYEKRRELKQEPFQGIYNRIANDMLVYQRKLTDQRLEELRTISEIRFAREFSPQAFDNYLVTNRKGELELSGLPPENDPQLQRIRKIRERDYLFVDTMQEYYDAFSRRMEVPYHEWRANSYGEILAVRELKRQSRNRTIAGVASIIGGIAAQTSDNRATRAAGAVAIGGGGLLVKSGLGKRDEVQMHVEALVELGQSLEAEIEPQVIDLEDRTITLTGNVNSQYEQWKELLDELYRAERGDL